LAEKVRKAIRKDLEEQQKYYEYIKAEKPDFFRHFERTEEPLNRVMMEVLKAIEQRYGAAAAKPNTVEGGATINTNAAPDRLAKDSLNK